MPMPQFRRKGKKEKCPLINQNEPLESESSCEALVKQRKSSSTSLRLKQSTSCTSKCLKDPLVTDMRKRIVKLEDEMLVLRSLLSDYQKTGDAKRTDNENDDDNDGLEVSSVTTTDCDSETTDDEDSDIELPTVAPPAEFQDYIELESCFKYHIRKTLCELVRPAGYLESRPDVDGTYCFDKKLRLANKLQSHLDLRAKCISDLTDFLFDCDLFIQEFLFVYFGEGIKSNRYPIWKPSHDYFKTEVDTRIFLDCLACAEVTLSLGEQSDEYQAYKAGYHLRFTPYIHTPIPSSKLALKVEHFKSEVAEYRTVSGSDYELPEYRHL